MTGGKYLRFSRKCSLELWPQKVYFMLAWKMESKCSCKILYLPTKLYGVTVESTYASIGNAVSNFAPQKSLYASLKDGVHMFL